MTPLNESRRRFLGARDARQAELDRHLAARWPSLVAASLAIPGEEKVPAGSAELFGWALARLAGALPAATPLHASADALGPFAIWASAEDPRKVKELCVAIETSRPAARLLDLDVHAPGGWGVDRAALGLSQRRCLCCDAPARECIRLGRHPYTEIISRAHELLAAFRP